MRDKPYSERVVDEEDGSENWHMRNSTGQEGSAETSQSGK